MERAQVIKCRHGKIFAASMEPECYSSVDWQKDMRKYVKDGCVVDLAEPGSFHFELCEECFGKKKKTVRNDEQTLFAAQQ